MPLNSTAPLRRALTAEREHDANTPQLIHTAVALPALAAVPTVATVCKAARSVPSSQINAYREARSGYDALFQVPGDRFDEDPEIDAALKALCVCRTPRPSDRSHHRELDCAPSANLRPS